MIYHNIVIGVYYMMHVVNLDQLPLIMHQPNASTSAFNFLPSEDIFIHHNIFLINNTDKDDVALLSMNCWVKLCL